MSITRLPKPGEASPAGALGHVGVVFVPRAAAGEHERGDVLARQHQPVAELIVQPAVFPVDHQPGGQQLLLGEALVCHGAEQRVPLVQRSAHAEAHRDTPPYLPLVQIRLHRRPLLGLEHAVIVPGGIPVQRQHPAAELFRSVAALLRYREVGPLGQELHRLRERQALDLHNKIDDAAALFAAEAVVDLLVRRYGERWRFLVVEGAQAEQVAALARQRHVAGYHVRNVVPRHHFVQKLVAEMHEKPSFPPPNRGAK